jgi:hypothetical protein
VGVARLPRGDRVQGAEKMNILTKEKLIFCAQRILTVESNKRNFNK